jgi:hypothetical protein
MARAIVRYSCDKAADKNKAKRARGAVRKILTDAGFERRGTGSWELDGATSAEVGRALKEVFEVVEGLDPKVLDHIWTYCDD